MGFGADVRSPADGVVVTVHDRERDHWSRMGWLALPFLVVESAARELTGPGQILGNHVVLDLGGGVYAALAHLQRRSVRVRPGDVVRAGTVIASCGNSGNSSEPHLHLQVMDTRGRRSPTGSRSRSPEPGFPATASSSWHRNDGGAAVAGRRQLRAAAGGATPLDRRARAGIDL